VHDRVQFEGCRPRDALRAWYAASDVFVTTPWYEPFGITPLEAMACARPVVGSAVGGIQYTVEDGLTGLLVPPKDPALLAQRLLTLHAEPLRAAAMGQAGLERVQRMFTWEQVARRLAAVYAGAAQPRERVPVGFYVATGAEQAPAALPASAPRRPLQPAVFIDKDGTLVHDVPYNVDPRRLRYTPRAFEGLAALRRAGYRLVMVTNQPGLAQGRFDRPALARLHAALAATGRARGAPFDGFYACGHAPAADGRPQCACRKPAPGLLLHAAQALDIDLARSWMVGDILDDIEAGRRAGCRTVLIDNGNETLWQMSPLRQPDHRCPDLAAAAQAILAHRDPAQPAGEPLPAGAALPVLLNAPPSSQATMGARAAA
jgi:histidinol-phosphate phosphatase family protein